MGVESTRSLWQAIALTLSLALSFAASATAMEGRQARSEAAPILPQSSSFTSTQGGSALNAPSLLEGAIAQAPGSCYELIQENGTYIQEGPTVYSDVLAPIYYGEDVAIASGGDNYWTYITEPVSGYVWTEWLAPCQTVSQSSPATPLPDNCRLVLDGNNLAVWPGPAESGLIAGYVPGGQTVTIDSLGSEGWVPISEPIPGYIQAANLTYCR